MASAKCTITAVSRRIETANGFPELAVIHLKKSASYFPELEPDIWVEETEDFIHYPWQRIDDSDYRIKLAPVMAFVLKILCTAPGSNADIYFVRRRAHA
ncbi:MAG: hypothetical protein U0175_07025 [Caldilineaceae bacterium]